VEQVARPALAAALGDPVAAGEPPRVLSAAKVVPARQDVEAESELLCAVPARELGLGDVAELAEQSRDAGAAPGEPHRVPSAAADVPWEFAAPALPDVAALELLCAAPEIEGFSIPADAAVAAARVLVHGFVVAVVAASDKSAGFDPGDCPVVDNCAVAPCQWVKVFAAAQPGADPIPVHYYCLAHSGGAVFRE